MLENLKPIVLYCFAFAHIIPEKVDGDYRYLHHKNSQAKCRSKTEAHQQSSLDSDILNRAFKHDNCSISHARWH